MIMDPGTHIFIYLDVQFIPEQSHLIFIYQQLEALLRSFVYIRFPYFPKLQKCPR